MAITNGTLRSHYTHRNLIYIINDGGSGDIDGTD